MPDGGVSSEKIKMSKCLFDRHRVKPVVEEIMQMTSTLLTGESVRAALQWNMRLIGMLVIVFGMLRVEHLERFTARRTNASHA